MRPPSRSRSARLYHRPHHRDDAEYGQTAKHQQYRIGGSDQSGADIPDPIASEQQHRGPDDRRGDIGEPKPAAPPPHDARRQRYHSPHRAEKAAAKKALTPAFLKKPHAVWQQ